MLAQQLQAIGGFGRQADGHMAVVADFQANVLLAEVGFVANQGDLAGVWALFQKFRPQRKRVGRFRSGGIHHQQHPVSFTDGLQGTGDTDFFHLIISGPQARRVHHVQRHAIDKNVFAQHIAGSTGDVGDNRRFTSGQCIQ